MGRARSVRGSPGRGSRSSLVFLGCVFVCLLAAACALPQSLPEETSLSSLSEKTSNAIPEAEQDTHEALSKSRKVQGEPFPYVRASDGEETKNIERRSGLAGRLNGTLMISVSESTTPSLESSTEPTELTTLTEEPSSPITGSYSSSTLPTSITLVPELTGETTTVSTDDETEVYTPAFSTSSVMPETETAETTLATEAASTTQAGSSSDLPPTTTEETIPTTLEDEPATIMNKDIQRETTTTTSTTTTTQATKMPTMATTMTVTTTPTATTTSPTVLTTIPTVPTTIPTTSTTMTTQTATTTTTTTQAATTTTTTTPVATTTTMETTAAMPMTSTLPTSSSTATASTPEVFSSVTTWLDEVTDSTTDPISPTVPTEDVTLLVRIVLEGTWQDVCSKLPILRQSLTDLVNNSMEKTISPGQIVFHQTQCATDNLAPKSLMSEMPMTSLLVYVVDENGNFDEKLTKILPSLYEMSPIDFPLTIHSFVLVQESDSGNAIAVVIVSCVAFICLILLAGLLFIMRKRQGRFNYGERCRPVSLDAYSLDSVSAYNSVRRSKVLLRASKRSYGNPTFEDSSAAPSHPLDFAGLARMSDDEVAIAEEFASIPQVSAKIDELPTGAEVKNRYANVIPLPESRVSLKRLDDDPLTEYINASYVRGPKNASKYYIACQGPTEETVPDFWRMVWEQQCRVIIMLTDLEENGVEKCAEYIPPLEVSDCHRLYGDYQVTLKKREAKEKYAISSLHLKNLESNTFREVSHIWYLWPANGVPRDAASLIAVLLEARALQRGAAGPVLVHCSPGTGRTGAVIALDLCIRQYEVTRTVDVPRVVYSIRRDRAGAVQTREQYAFVYKGLKLYAGKLANGATESA